MVSVLSCYIPNFFFVHIQTALFSEIQFLEQNYDIVKCNIWMRQVAEIQNKVKKTGGLLLRFIGLSFFSINCTLRRFVYTSLQCRAIVAEKIVQRFDVVKVPRYSMLNVAVVVNYHSFEVSLCLCVFYALSLLIRGGSGGRVQGVRTPPPLR